MVEIRKKFAVAISFVTNMLSLSALNEVWSKIKPANMSEYNFGVKQNYPLSSAEKPTVNNMLTPKDGFPLDVTTAEVTADTVTAQLAALDTVMIPADEERELTPNLVLCYYNPVNAEDAPYAIVPVAVESQIIDTANPLALNIPLNIVQKQTAAKYQNSILFLALTTHDQDGKVIQYSATYAQDN